MKNPVNATQIHKGAVTGDIFDGAFQDNSFFQYFENFLFEIIPFLLEQNSTRNDHVSSRSVIFEDGKSVFRADKAVEIAAGPNIDMKSRKKAWNSYIDFKSSLDLADDLTFNASSLVVGFFDLFPQFNVFRALP